MSIHDLRDTSLTPPFRNFACQLQVSFARKLEALTQELPNRLAVSGPAPLLLGCQERQRLMEARPTGIQWCIIRNLDMIIRQAP